MCQLHNAPVLPQEEGLVLKQPDSPWRANDRSGAWVKVKPEWVRLYDTVNRQCDGIPRAAWSSAGPVQILVSKAPCKVQSHWSPDDGQQIEWNYMSILACGNHSTVTPRTGARDRCGGGGGVLWRL